MLANRLRKRFRHLRKWARRTGVTCFRVYERDIPDAPCIVDWYDGEAVLWISGRKRDETPEQDVVWRRSAIDAVESGLDLPREKIFVKERERQKGLDQYERVDRRGHVRVVEEFGLRFEVNLSDYLDTGLFLDHRNTRRMVREESSGRQVLNLFAYTGSFTCFAAAGGAAATTTVDMSRTYCDWTARNLALNGFATGDTHRVLREDCLAFLERDTGRFDLIVCDPPTFSNSKRMAAGSFSVDRDHPELVASCARRLAPRGVLYFSTNSRRFRLQEETLPAGLDAVEISAKTVPEDFRNERIHRAWRMEASGHSPDTGGSD